MRPRSLRTRLVATVLLLLLVAATVIAVWTALALRGFLVGRLDSDLRFTSARINRDGPVVPGQGPGPPPESTGQRSFPSNALGAQITNGVVVTAWVSDRDGKVRDIPPTQYPNLLAVAPGAPPMTVDLGPVGFYRVIANDRFGGPVLVAGVPEAQVRDTVYSLVTTELIVTAVALVGGGLVGAIIVRRELRPLERVAATASRVSALPLDRGEVSLVERVPDVNPATEVGQVGAALNRMLDHVGAALEARQDSETQLRQFIADASHELRTPLAAIRGYAELTRRTELPPDAEYSLVRIASQAKRMTTLVEDLLLLARLDAGRPLERGEVDLTRLVLDGVSDARAAGPTHGWQLTLPEEPVTVPGDGSRLAQVLANLLANARTHTPPGTVVTVALAVQAGGARLAVVDEGPGISPDLLPHVFERFTRGSSARTRENGSTGLGLSIVDAVVSAHGGSVSVSSGTGCTEFSVWLPGAALPPEGRTGRPVAGIHVRRPEAAAQRAIPRDGS